MPLQVSILIEPLETAEKVPLLTKALHSFALELISRSDPQWADTLLADQSPKPFSVAGPLLSADGGLATALYKGRVYCLVMSALDERTAVSVKQALANGIAMPEIHLDSHILKVVSVNFQESNYHDLFNGYFPDGPFSRQIELAFQTPTSFRSGKKAVPLPLPELVFGSLLEKWNLFSPYTLSQHTKDFARENVAVSYYDLRAWNLYVAGGKHPAFAGRCGFYVLSQDPYWCRTISLLADFACYAGVGIKTTMGMGKVTRVCRDSAPSATAKPSEQTPKEHSSETAAGRCRGQAL